MIKSPDFLPLSPGKFCRFFAKTNYWKPAGNTLIYKNVNNSRKREAKGRDKVYTMEAANDSQAYILQEERSQNYCKTAQSGIIFIDAELRVQSFSRESERLLGLESAQVLGRNAENAFRRFSNNFLKSFSISDYDEFYSSEFKLKNREKNIYIHINALKIKDVRGAFCGIIVILQDISAFRSSVKRQNTQIISSLGGLAGGVAHHIRTPLTTISGYLQIMIKRIEREGNTLSRDILEMLLTEVAYINNVVKELILFAKPPVYKKTGIDINKVLEEALRVNAAEIANRKILVEKRLAPLPHITADAHLLKQALVNIIKNSVEAVAENGRLDINTWVHSEVNMLVIAISDNGQGINSQTINRIFEPFFTTKLDRLGLGLSNSQRIVAEHNGSINIVSWENAGTKVHMYLPLDEPRLTALDQVCQQTLNLHQ